MKNFLSGLLFLILCGRVEAADLPWLRADGGRIVDERGKQVVLSGVNLGGWLVEEMWMMPFETRPPQNSGFKAIKDYLSLWHTAEKRFGPAEANRLRTAMRNAWITPADFDRIRAAGLNCVRLPFTYDLLQEPNGFIWLDQTLQWARERGLYVILDLHGAPGRQSGDHHTGESDVNQLFRDPEMVRQTEAVWTQIAQRYRDRPEVAGYDLLNEPMGAPDVATLYLVTDRLFRAVRAVDKRHIIIVEDGYKGRDSFPRPAMVGWDNVMLSWHHYNFNAKTEQEQTQGLLKVASDASRISRTRMAPIFIGETQLEPHGTPNSLTRGLAEMQQRGHSWTIWNYKSAMKDGGGGMWGWYRAPKALQPLDFYRDSPAELIRKADQMRTENMEENQALTTAFKTVAQVRPLPPLQEVVPTAQTAPIPWRYTFEKPAGNWFAPNFNAAAWQEGAAGFGNDWTFEGMVRTAWKTNDIWLRREFTLPNLDFSTLRLFMVHDDEAEVYLNGVLAARLDSYTHSYAEELISPEALATLKPGRNIMAVHCHQGSGGQYIDVGMLGSTATTR